MSVGPFGSRSLAASKARCSSIRGHALVSQMMALREGSELLSFALQSLGMSH